MVKRLRNSRKRRWKFKHRICEFDGCGDMFLAMSSTHRFCGSVLKKKSCSYMNRQLQIRKYREKHPKLYKECARRYFQNHRKLFLQKQQDLYWKNRTERLIKMAKYYRNNRARVMKRRRVLIGIRYKTRFLSTD